MHAYVIDIWICIDEINLHVMYDQCNCVDVFQAVDYGVHKLWEKNNVGVMF